MIRVQFLAQEFRMLAKKKKKKKKNKGDHLFSSAWLMVRRAFGYKFFLILGSYIRLNIVIIHK